MLLTRCKHNDHWNRLLWEGWCWTCGTKLDQRPQCASCYSFINEDGTGHRFQCSDPLGATVEREEDK